MSHRKSHSHGSIPFSWEDKPGVCKTPNNECPLNIGSQHGITQKASSISPLPLPPLAPNHLSNSKRMLEIHDKIPLPPCQLQPPRRSTSEKDKGFRWQEDPFLVAYKECTKSDEKSYKVPRKNKKGVGSNFSLSKSIFSCRSTNDVQDDIYVKLSHRPCLPAVRDRSLTLEDEHKRGFNYETWL